MAPKETGYVEAGTRPAGRRCRRATAAAREASPRPWSPRQQALHAPLPRPWGGGARSGRAARQKDGPTGARMDEEAKMPKMDDELEQLRKVTCGVVLEQDGWAVDKRESTRRAVKYRRAEG